jgi:hypothetical protein
VPEVGDVGAAGRHPGAAARGDVLPELVQLARRDLLPLWHSSALPLSFPLSTPHTPGVFVEECATY